MLWPPKNWSFPRYVRRRMICDFFALEDWSFRLRLRVDLSRFGAVVQATLSDGVSFDPFALEQDGLAAPEVDVSRGEIVEAFVISAMVVVH